MSKSASYVPLGIIRSTAVISLGLVSLAGSVATVLVRRLLTPAETEPADAQISQLVIDEWETDLARLNLPSRREVDAVQQHLVELEAQIDQLIAERSGASDAS